VRRATDCESRLLAGGGREPALVVEPYDSDCARWKSLTDHCAFQILFEVRNRFHSDQRGTEGQQLGECYRAPSIAVEFGEGGTKLLGKRSRELRLHECGASNYSYSKAVRRLEQRNAVGAHTLGGNPYRLGHCEVDRELDDPEVVVFASR
jgi:hypothetical protein